MKTFNLFFVLSIMLIMLSCSTTPNFKKDRKLSLENATFISIWTVFESRITDDEMLTILNQKIYDSIPLFAWFTQTHFLQDSMYNEFSLKLIDISKLDFNSKVKSNDAVEISLINNGQLKHYLLFNSEIQIFEYIKLLERYFKYKIGIPENMIKKYTNNDI